MTPPSPRSPGYPSTSLSPRSGSATPDRKGLGCGDEDSPRFHSALALPSNDPPMVEVLHSHRCNAVGIRGALCYLRLTRLPLQMSVSFILRSPCRLTRLQDLPAFTTGLADCTQLVGLRVHRLLDWNESSSPAVPRRWWFFLPLGLVISYTVTHYGQVLLFTHRFTEWFIH